MKTLHSTPMYRTALTGATGGIGKAMARKLATQSSHLLLLGRQDLALKRLADELALDHPHLEVASLAGDLLDPDYTSQVSALAAKMQINLLINNAGINHFGANTQLAPGQQQQIIHTNLLAPMALTQTLLPHLLRQAQAQVIQVGSIFGYIGYPGNAAYCASKFGLRGYAQALARELSNTTVKVKYFAPRATQTAINTDAVCALNAELKVQSDSPEYVAEQLLEFLHSKSFELKLGWPEKLFVFLNQLFPFINDKAIAGQLPTIQKHFQGEHTS